MRRVLILGMASVLALFGASCSDNGPSNQQAESKPAAPKYPAELDKVAQRILGTEAEVISYGDLAKNGKQEALIINRVKIRPETMQPGLLVTRAVIVEKDGDSWQEVFLCDEHLKNPKGFLGGQPVAAVGGWRLQMETDPKTGLAMYFTPLQTPKGGYMQTYEVKWNPEVKRYETLDRNFEHFLKELPTLEPIQG